MKLECLSLRCNIRLWLPTILSFSFLNTLHLADEGQSFSSTKPFSLSKLSNLQHLTLENCISHGYCFPELPLNLTDLSLYNHTTLEQLPDLSRLEQLKNLFILNCISLQSLPPLPPHLQSLEAHECTSLQDIPDLSILKELEALSFIGCSNLKSVSLKQSCLQVGHDEFSYSFRATLPNREIAQWFNYKSRGCTVSFEIPPILGDNFLGVTLWVVYKCCSIYKCKLTDFFCYIRAVITNKTAGTIEDYNIYAPIDSVGEVRSMVECIRKETISLKGGDKIKVSFQRFLYCFSGGVEFPYEEVKVEMCGAHVIQKTPSTSQFCRHIEQPRPTQI